MKHIKLEYEQLYEFINLKLSDDVPHHHEYNLSLFNHIFKHDYVPLDYNEVVTYLNSFNDYNIEIMYFIDVMYTYMVPKCFKLTKMTYKIKNHWCHQDSREYFLYKKDLLNSDIFIITK